MDSKLTVKSPIKNSTDLFKRKKYSEEMTRKNKLSEKPSKLRIISLFLLITITSFFIFWIILCPLIWTALKNKEETLKWPQFWPYLFWTVSFIIWLIFMMIIWTFRYKKKLEEPKVSTNTETVKKEKKLPPLVIQKNVNDDRNDEISETPTASNLTQDINRKSMKEYLKIVTIDTPLLEEKVIPETSSKSSEDKIEIRNRFFSNEDKLSTDITVDTRRYTMSDNQFEKLFEKENLKKRNSEYFIANIKSPIVEKSEVFLEIDEPKSVQVQEVVVDKTIH